MKRSISQALSLLMSLVLLLSLLPGMAFASTPDKTVYVTVSRSSYFVTDQDQQSVVRRAVTVQADATLDDALRALHDSSFPGGSAEGYGSVGGAYGTSLTKLWGDTSQNFGYYVNSEMAMNLDVPLSDGDWIDAIIYQYAYPDTEAYACFDTQTATVGTDTPLELTLSYVSGYNPETYAPMFSPLPDAAITVDGQISAYTTDQNGKVFVSLADAGVHVISAVGPQGTAITAPAFVVTAVAPVTVEVSAQYDYAFSYMRRTLTVSYGTAAAYGFSGNETAQVTALDALVAAHRDYYGSNFTKETAQEFLTVNAGGSPVAMFKNKNTEKYSGFSINHQYPMDSDGTGYSAAEAPLSNGNLLDFFYYEDTNWSDYLTWFTDSSEKPIYSISVETGETFSVKLRGFVYMLGYSKPTALDTYGEESSLSLYSLDDEGFPAEPLAEVSSAGGATLSFPDPGDYWITALGFQQDGYSVICPLLKVIVKEDGSITDNEVTDLTVSNHMLTPEFRKDAFAYTLSALPYDTGSISAKLTFPEGAEVSARYRDSRDADATVTGFLSGTAKSLPNLKAGSTDIAFSIVPDSSSLSRSYTLTAVRETALTGLSLRQDGRNVALDSAFAPNVTGYTATALAGTDLELTPIVGGDSAHTGVTVNGISLTGGTAVVPIQAGDNTIAVKAASADGTTEKTYTLAVTGVDSTQCTFTLGTAGSVLKLYDASGAELAPIGGTTAYAGLTSGLCYTYNVSKYGYVTAHGMITAGTDTALAVTLAAAPANTLQKPDAQWKNFRNSDVNMAITDAKTPRSAAEAQLKWEQAVGSVNGWQIENAPGLPLIVDGYLYHVSGTTLQKRSLTDGSLAASGAMAAQSAYTYTAPAYGEGMIFVPLSGGIVQAFDAKTLQSLWVYTDPLGGQDQVSVTYSDGYVYTGFYNSRGSGNYVCLPATDEDPGRTDETKCAAWTVPSNNGFYWATAYVGDTAVIAASEKGTLYALDKITGTILDTASFEGSGRSGIAYDAPSGKLFFTTTEGYLYKTSVNADGQFSALETCKLGVASTSTPVVYGGSVFVGATCALKDWRILMIDAASMTVSARTEKLSGYPQSSLLASTGYLALTGKIYLYTSCNAAPGGITVVEADLSEKTLTASQLFAPTHSGFSVSSLICDPYGTLYHKNDAGYLFAVAAHSVTGCPVSFTCTPADAEITLRDSLAQVISPVSIGGTVQSGSYVLPAGAYTYTISRGGYETKSGSFTVAAEEAETHAGKNFPVALSPAPILPTAISVSFELLGDVQHSDATVHTYRKNGSALPVWIPTAAVSTLSGSSVLDVFRKAVSAAGLSYQESNGYISGIQAPDGGMLSEFDNGANSGWLYMVNGAAATQSMGEYALSNNDRIVVFYSDDYTKESGSEQWKPDVILPPGSAFIAPSATVSGKVASAAVTDQKITEAIQALGKSPEDELVIEPVFSDDAPTLVLSISKASVQSIVSATSAALRIQGPDAALSIPNDTLASIAKQMAGDRLEIKTSLLPQSSLPALLGKLSGDGASAVEITLVSQGQKITRFGGATLLVRIPAGNGFPLNSPCGVLSISEDGNRETLGGTCLNRDGRRVVETAAAHLSIFIALPRAAVRFDDVPLDFWCYDAVSYVTENGLFHGTGPSAFSPNAAMTRAMLVTVLYRLDGTPAPDAARAPAFTDIQSGNWCGDAVAWASQNGIVNGYSAVLFGKDDPVSRQQLAAILYRYAAYHRYDTGKSADLSDYTDMADVAGWAASPLRWARAEGLMNGSTVSTLSPSGQATRAQVAAILSRFCKNFTTEA
jgi:FOG: WD40-like repeat